MLAHTKMLLWRTLALLALFIGFAGLFAPVMPTVPFLILAAWASGKGWPELEARLLSHPHFGRHIRDWREQGAVPRRAKWLASLMMLISAIGLQFTPLSLWLKVGAPLCLLAASIWLWCRPEGRSG
jgi:uncharacterized protein